jgi:hypothetical protein
MASYVLSTEALSYIRPLYSYVTTYIIGYLNGFLIIDPQAPFWYFTDGPTNIYSSVYLFKKYYNDGRDPNVYNNFYDTTVPLQYNLNLLNSGFVSLGMLAVTKPIIRVLTKYPSFFWFIPLFVYFGF